MTVIVTDTGFAADDWTAPVLTLTAFAGAESAGAEFAGAGFAGTGFAGAGFAGAGFAGTGFAGAGFAARDAGPVLAVDLGPTDDPCTLRDRIGRLGLIRVAFDAFNDGRGFTIARKLRAMGYQRRLRARGHVLADQYTMIRRAGFDEVEIGADLAARQPQDQWQRRADWRAHDYQSRLRT